MKKVITAISAAILLSFAAVSEAKNLSKLEIDKPVVFSTIERKGSFVEIFEFSLPKNSELSLNFMSIFMGYQPDRQIGFTNFNLFSVQEIPNSRDVLETLVYTTNYRTFSWQTVSGGDYYLVVDGFSTVHGSAFRSTFSLSPYVPSPVPEPTTFAMFGLGAVLVGLALKGKK